MSKGRKRLDPATVEAEAEALRKLWESAIESERGTQAEFGERLQIGSQGLMWQLLNGKTPISLKAGKAFAVGLKCKLSDFSPRLAALETAWPFELVDRELYDSLSPALQHRAQLRMTDEMQLIFREQERKANGTNN
jgi:transcriptional regulator with XRE-family HTH domain